MTRTAKLVAAINTTRQLRFDALRPWIITGVPTRADLRAIDRRVAQDLHLPSKAVDAVPHPIRAVG